MPYFTQEPLSYLTLPTIRNAYKAFNIKLNFRPDNVDGEAQIHAALSYFHVKSCGVFFFFSLLTVSVVFPHV